MSQTGLDQATETALLGMLALILKKPFERVGEIVDTRMSLWQFRNMVAVGERAKKDLTTRGLRIEDLPPKLREVVPILEHAKNEDDETLQSMWAALLASSFDPNEPDFQIPFAQLLASLSPLQGRILEVLFFDGDAIAEQEIAEEDRLVALLVEKLGVTNDDINLSIKHLSHIGLITSFAI
jgi:hypothetical protein